MSQDGSGSGLGRGTGFPWDSARSSTAGSTGDVVAARAADSPAPPGLPPAELWQQQQQQQPIRGLPPAAENRQHVDRWPQELVMDTWAWEAAQQAGMGTGTWNRAIGASIWATNPMGGAAAGGGDVPQAALLAAAAVAEVDTAASVEDLESLMATLMCS